MPASLTSPSAAWSIDCAARQSALWSQDPEVQAKIANRLGWLGAPDWVLPSLPRIARVADAIRRDGFSHIVLLGMGGIEPCA